MTSRQHGKRAIVVSSIVRFQDGDAIVIGSGGTALFRLLLLSFNVCTCASVSCHYVHALLWCSGLCDIRVLLCTMHVNVRGI